MTREQLIKALREHARVDSLFGNDVRKHLSEQAADMLEADGVPVGYFNGRFGSVSEPDGVWAEITVLDALPTAGAKLYTAPQPATQERKPCFCENRGACAHPFCSCGGSDVANA